MARQTYYVTREQKHPLYRTRMLQAGPLDLDASAARLYRQLGVELSDEAPKRAAAQKITAGLEEAVAHSKGELAAKETTLPTPKPAAKKAAPKRRRKKS